MDKKMGTAEEEPAEPSESQPHDDDDEDDDDGIWMEDWDSSAGSQSSIQIPSCKVTGKEQSQGKGQGKSTASSQGKEAFNNEEA